MNVKKLVVAVTLCMAAGAAIAGGGPPSPGKPTANAGAAAGAAAGAKSSSASVSGAKSSSGAVSGSLSAAKGGEANAAAKGGVGVGVGVGGAGGDGGDAVATGGAGGSAAADGGLGVGEVNVGGDSTSFNSSSEYMSLVYASDLPESNADMCSLYAGAGGGGDGGGGFIQWPFMNKACWHQKLAGGEVDVDLVARLKCADKFYRRAVAYEHDGRDRRGQCIAKVRNAMQGWVEQNRAAKERAQQRELELVRARTELARALAACEEKVERCEAAVLK